MSRGIEPQGHDSSCMKIWSWGTSLTLSLAPLPLLGEEGGGSGLAGRLTNVLNSNSRHLCKRIGWLVVYCFGFFCDFLAFFLFLLWWQRCCRGGLPWWNVTSENTAWEVQYLGDKSFPLCGQCTGSSCVHAFDGVWCQRLFDDGDGLVLWC